MRPLRKNILILTLVVLLTLVAGFFVYPRYFGAKYKPWRLGLDLVGGSSLIYQIDLTNIPVGERPSAVAGLKEVIEKRVNLFGVTEPRVTIAQKGDNYQLLVDLAGVKDIEEAKKQIGATPVLDFREVEGEGENVTYRPTELTGRYLTRASKEFDQFNQPYVSLTFNDEGARIFEELTRRNVGRRLAVFLDNRLFTDPVVREEIRGGKAQITLGEGPLEEKLKEADLLVERFNAGALSAPIQLVNQRTVSPTAAGNALRDIIFAGLLGTILVMAFMTAYYRSLGLFSVFALIVYIILTLAFFKLIPHFIMTLAGLAGFVLSIGMAVDANILIFERTKEEIKRGVAKTAAIEEGFRRAWPSIRDSNVSTIITAIILYFLTSSFVKGFALTLGIGVIVSMFSAIFVTRTMLRVFIREKNA
jgi:protein-export membrane protein SecD